MSWKSINQEIRRCRRIPDINERIACLKELFREKQDGMVALALGEELEANGELEEALKYFEEAERLFPLPAYKERARVAALRIRDKILKERRKIEGIEAPPTPEITKINLDEHDPQTTLIVVACTKTKIWDLDENAPEFVPARMAYQGDSFRKFLRWAEDNGLEQKGFKWIILSAKYGYIEPWHPISNYNVTFDDEATGPISDETLYRQVMYQTRWSGISLKSFKRIICFGSKFYVDKVRKSFKDTCSHVISLLE